MDKKIINLLVVLFSITTLNAQKHEIGLRLGQSNVVGDIGITSYLMQKPSKDFSTFGVPLYASFIYRLNFNPHQSLRFDAGYNAVQFDDNKAKEEYRRNRKMFGTNTIYDANLIFEYNFFSVNNEQKSLLSPYIFAGVGGIVFDTNHATMHHDFTRDEDGVALAPTSEIDFQSTVTYENRKKFSFTVPFGVGLKYKFNYNWALSLEAMFRPTFTDQLDYSMLEDDDLKATYNTDIKNPGTNTSLLQTGIYYGVTQQREKEFVKERTFGNTKSNDWLNTVSLGITYSFGKEPCFCN